MGKRSKPDQGIQPQTFYQPPLEAPPEAGVVDRSAQDIRDEIYDDGYNHGFSDGLYIGAQPVVLRPKPTKLRVTLSRRLTWSEREAFREAIDGVYDSHRFNTNNSAVVYVSASGGMDSRELAWELHDWFATELFNVHIHSVKTIYPEVVV